MSVFFLVAVALISGTLWRVAARRRRTDDAWWTLASRLKLDLGGHDFREIDGKVGGLSVRIAEVSRGSGKSEKRLTRVVVSGPLVGHGLRVTSEGVFAKIQKFLGASDVLLGDPEFDRAVHLQGSETTVVAYMNEELRDALARLMQDAPGAEVTPEGSIEFEQPGPDLLPNEVELVVRRMLDVAKALQLRTFDPASRLAANAVGDRMPAIRQRNLELLVRDYPDDPETRRAVDAALGDAAAGVRLVAARAVRGSAGFGVLRAIVQGGGRSEELLAALEELVGGWPYEEVAPVLDGVLKTGRPELRELAVRTIGRQRDSSRLDGVLRTATHGVPALDEAVATVLGQIGDARAEPTLLAYLEHEEPAVRVEAALSLGRVGTVAAVEPLLPHTIGLMTPGALKEAARDAIRRIQARLGRVETGRLSVVADTDATGALSLAGEGGELAVTDDPSPVPPRRERD